LGGGKASRLCPGISDVDLFGYGESVVDLNAEVAHLDGFIRRFGVSLDIITVEDGIGAFELKGRGWCIALSPFTAL
jgi:hypothetical protein